MWGKKVANKIMGNRKRLENVGTRHFIGETVVELCQADYTHKNPHLYGRKNVHNSVDNVDKHGKTAEILSLSNCG